MPNISVSACMYEGWVCMCVSMVYATTWFVRYCVCYMCAVCVVSVNYVCNVCACVYISV